MQAKLRIGEPNSPFEQEAERVSDQIMKMSEPKSPKRERRSSADAADSIRRTGAVVIRRKENAEDGDSEVKGGGFTPAAPIVKHFEKIFADAPQLPPELRSKEKAYFLITYEPDAFHMYTDTVPGFDASEKESIQDEMEYLQSVGYLVVYIEHATENDIINAFADPHAAFIFSTGHGEPPGDIRTANEDRVEPGEITIPPGSELSQVVLEHCNIGDQYEKWKEVLPRFAILTAWEGETTTRESVEFNSGGGFSDRQWGSLMSRVESLPILENQLEGKIYQVTEKGVITKEIEEPVSE